MSSERWRPIMSSSDAPPRYSRYTTSRTPRASVPVACTHCRVKKAKCDAIRPSCSRCDGLGLSCEYDVVQGVSRAERFKMQKQHKASIANNLTTIVDALRSSSDAEATTILARLRLGEPVEELAQFLSINNALLMRGNSRISTNALELYPQSVSKSALPILDMPAKYSFELSSSNLVTDGSEGLTDSTLVEDDHFLSVIFSREDLCLPISLQTKSKEEASVALSSSLAPGLSQKGKTNSIGERTLGMHPAPSSGAVWSDSNSFDTHGNPSSLYAPWTLYPAVRGGLVIPPSYNSIMEQEKALRSLPSELPLPSWALMTVNTRSASGSMGLAFTIIHAKCTALIQRGRAQSDVFGKLPNVSALFDKSEYEKSSLLSQWAASMVHSIKLQGYDFTCFASMHVFWYLMRWMVAPSRETYEAMPRWLRPVPNQLFIPHTHMLDFIIWPKLREFVLSTPPLQEKTEWLFDLSTNIQCRWPLNTREALRLDDETGLTMLTEQAEERIATLSAWSVAPTFRAYVPNADLYVSVR